MVVSVAKPDRRLPADLEYLVANALGAVLALAARVANSSSLSNSLGGIVHTESGTNNPDLMQVNKNIYLFKEAQESQQSPINSALPVPRASHQLLTSILLH